MYKILFFQKWIHSSTGRLFWNGMEAVRLNKTWKDLKNISQQMFDKNKSAWSWKSLFELNLFVLGEWVLLQSNPCDLLASSDTKLRALKWKGTAWYKWKPWGGGGMGRKPLPNPGLKSRSLMSRQRCCVKSGMVGKVLHFQGFVYPMPNGGMEQKGRCSSPHF